MSDHEYPTLSARLARLLAVQQAENTALRKALEAKWEALAVQQAENAALRKALEAETGGNISGTRDPKTGNIKFKHSRYDEKSGDPALTDSEQERLRRLLFWEECQDVLRAERACVREQTLANTTALIEARKRLTTAYVLRGCVWG